MPLPDRPIRFLQVNTFYRPYIEDFYKSYPHLAQSDYDSQINAILDDGFSAGHIFSRQLKLLGFETMQVIDDNPVSQAAWLLQNSDQISQKIDFNDVVKLQIETFCPDILYFTNIVPFETKFLQSLQIRPSIVAGWRGFPLPEGLDLSGYDLVLTSFDRILAEARALGAQDVIRFHPGFPEDPTFLSEPRSIKWDVVFSGSATQEHANRIEVLELIAQLSRDPQRPFSFGLFMPDASGLPLDVQHMNQGARWGNDMLRTLRDSQIVINTDIDAFGNQPPNMRLLEATGAGAFLITPYHPELKNFFEPGSEIETFRNQNELISKILYYLDNPGLCEDIAAAGQRRCLREHGLNSRAVWLKEIFLAAMAYRRSMD